jgi:hypothetical protein
MATILEYILQLDSVKWYKDSQEFYRENLRPELANRNMIFNCPGVKVSQRELSRNKGQSRLCTSHFFCMAFHWVCAIDLGHYNITPRSSEKSASSECHCWVWTDLLLWV